jgi:hypothetical protein
MMLCPRCQLGHLISEKLGYRCEFCDHYFRVDEVLIYYGDEEETEESQDRD